MSATEQQAIRNNHYSEAMRYIDNAKDLLQKAGKEGKHYMDDKYVKMACGTAYNAVLKALDGYFILKGLEKKRGRKSILFYQGHIARLDKKLLSDLNAAYEVLHLSGYYDGVTSVPVIQSGFEVANDIIKRVAPAA